MYASEKVGWDGRKIANSQGQKIGASERHFRSVESVNLRNGEKIMWS